MSTISPPPKGDSDKAQKYVKWLSDLLNKDKIEVDHTDLNKFDLNNLSDHYKVSLKDYEVEVSHSKHPDNDSDFYVMIFNNIEHIKRGTGDKVILAYIQLTHEQFKTFKNAADENLARRKKEDDGKKFDTTLKPIDNILEDLSSKTE